MSKRCGCVVEKIEHDGTVRDAIEKSHLCEYGLPACCEDWAVMVCYSDFWEERGGTRWCFMCEGCFEAHIPLCRAWHGMPPEEPLG